MENILIKLMRCRILKRFGIFVVVSFLGVGENFQDQGNNIVFYNIMVNVMGVVVLQIWVSLVDVFGSDFVDIVNSICNELLCWVDLIVLVLGDVGVLLNRSVVEVVLWVQYDLVFGDLEGVMMLVEFVIMVFGNGMLMLQYWILFFFLCGSVYFVLVDVFKINEFRIDLWFNFVDFDIMVQIQVVKLVVWLGKMDVLGLFVLECICLSLDILLENVIDVQWREFIKIICEFI